MSHCGAPIPEGDQERVDALRRLDVLDTLPEPAYDDIVALASHICGTPIALVSLVDADRQWFKARIGLDAQETHRDLAFCGHALLSPDDVMVVEDARLDTRFKESPLVLGAPFIRFYAGAPIITDTGIVLGTVCVIDTVVRTLTPPQRLALQALARQAAAFLQSREAARISQALAVNLEATVRERDAALDHAAIMAREIDHRVMNSLQMISALLEMQSQQQRDTEAGSAIRRAVGSVQAIARVHQHIYTADSAERADATAYLTRLCDECSRVFEHAALVSVEGPVIQVPTDDLVSLGLIVNELVTNSFKHGATKVSVKIGGANGRIDALSVSDDGPGPPPGFTLQGGRGLGMRVVRSLARKLGAQVSLECGVDGRGAVAMLRMEPASAVVGAVASA